MLVILDQNTGEHTAAYPYTSVLRIVPIGLLTVYNTKGEQQVVPISLARAKSEEFKEKLKDIQYAIKIELINGATHLLPCKSPSHLSSIFTALTGGKTSTIIHKEQQRKEKKDDKHTGVQAKGTATTTTEEAALIPDGGDDTDADRLHRDYPPPLAPAHPEDGAASGNTGEAGNPSGAAGK